MSYTDKLLEQYDVLEIASKLFEWSIENSELDTYRYTIEGDSGVRKIIVGNSDYFKRSVSVFNTSNYIELYLNRDELYLYDSTLNEDYVGQEVMAYLSEPLDMSDPQKALYRL